jgi:3-phenylpropionate/trans-cinnamate dioxygenase ferredoxin reductase component
MKPTFVVIGANLAGGRAAERLRHEGFDGRLVLIGAEPHPPYERPALSKEVLLGDETPESTELHPQTFYDDAEIELLLGARVADLDPSQECVVLEGGSRVHADKVLLCTGGRVRPLLVPGAELDGVYSLRTLEDMLGIREKLRPGASIVVIGAGFIGSEVAACAIASGCTVTMIELAQVPLSRVLGTDLGEIFASIHRDRGVDLRLGVGIDRIEGDEVGRARRVVTTDGSVIEADAIVVGVGVEPETTLAELAGIEIGNGIVVDEYCRTSLANVYAAGDVASFPNPILGERIRLEHWQNARNQAAAAARSMTGTLEPFSEVPWFWSDQYDVNLQLAGHPRATDEAVWRGDVDGLSFTCFYVREGVLTGAVSVNRPRDIRPSIHLIGSRAAVRLEQICDEDVDLRALVV